MKVLLTGSIAIDRIMNFPGKFADVIAPDKLHVLSVSVLLESLTDTYGGIAANIAYTLALLGEKPILFGSVGKESKPYMQRLKKLGVNISALHWSDLPTASFTVMTDRADCQVGGFFPGAMQDATALSLTKFEKADVFVVISPHDPTQMAIQVQECKNLGKRLFYDIGQQVSNCSNEDVRAGVEAAELLIVNDYEMGVIEKKTGWSLDEIRNKVKNVVVTLGEHGAVVYENGTQEKVEAVAGLEVVDPTGAGDAFRAGFLFGFIQGVSASFCAKFGCVTASFCVEHHGTQEHRFTLPQFVQRYKKTYAQVPDIKQL